MSTRNMNKYRKDDRKEVRWEEKNINKEKMNTGNMDKDRKGERKEMRGEEKEI